MNLNSVYKFTPEEQSKRPLGDLNEFTQMFFLSPKGLSERFKSAKMLGILTICALLARCFSTIH